MIYIQVELWPGGDQRRKRVLARAKIWNDGSSLTPRRGHYGAIFGGVQSYRRYAQVQNFPRQSRHVWELIRRALNSVDGKL